MAELKKQKLEEMKDTTGTQQDGEAEEQAKVEHANLLRLKFLAQDLSRFVKAEQKRRLKEQAAQELLGHEKEGEAKAKEENHADEAKVVEDSKPEGGAIPARGDQKLEEEKKHQDSDAEKSEDDEEQW